MHKISTLYDKLIATSLLITQDSIKHINSDTKINKPIKLNQISGALEVFNFQEAVEIADVIAKVRINKLISEFDQPGSKTIFSAEMLEIIKGNHSLHPNLINLLQQGNSKTRFNNNTLFAGEEE